MLQEGQRKEGVWVANGGLLDVVIMPVDVLNNQPCIAGKNLFCLF
jgi:hypothetical protein